MSGRSFGSLLLRYGVSGDELARYHRLRPEKARPPRTLGLARRLDRLNVRVSLDGGAAHPCLAPPLPGFFESGSQLYRVILRQQEIERTQPRMLNPQDNVGSAIDIADGNGPPRRHHQFGDRYICHRAPITLRDVLTANNT